jgi:hypothetical protein
MILKIFFSYRANVYRKLPGPFKTGMYQNGTNLPNSVSEAITSRLTLSIPNQISSVIRVTLVVSKVFTHTTVPQDNFLH